MRREADQIEAGTHPLFTNSPAIIRRLAAKALRDRADAFEGR
jgi:hypothetical protein